MGATLCCGENLDGIAKREAQRVNTLPPYSDWHAETNAECTFHPVLSPAVRGQQRDRKSVV